MKTFTTLFISLFFFSTISHAQWTSLNSGVVGQIFDLSFPTEMTGYGISPDSHIIKTTDGGTTWTSIYNTSVSNGRLYNASFLDKNTGYLVGDRGSLGTTLIIKTIDGGLSWDTLPTPNQPNTFLHDVHFLDKLNGFAIGGFYSFTAGTSFIIHTLDGGKTWKTVLDSIGNSLEEIHFVTPTIGYAVGMLGTIFKTNNGGASWHPQISGTNSSLHGVYFTSKDTGFAVGEGGTFLQTVNGGANWTSQNLGSTRNMFRIKFSSAQKGYIIGADYGELILKTINGGASWALEMSANNYALNALAVVNDTLAFAAGHNGVLIKRGNSHCQNAVISAVSASSDTLCAGAFDTLKVSGKLNDADNWYWYVGNCTGTPIDSGDAVKVNPSISTTYYVRAKGSCASPSNCLSQMISVKSCTFGVQEIKEEITSYPNPVKSSLFLRMEKQGIYDVQIFSIVGQKIIDLQFKNEKDFKINLEALFPGIYIVNIKTENFLKTLRIVKE